MKTLQRKILSIATLTALSCIGAAVVCAQKNAPLSVKADALNTTLISPTDYRQYLPLTAPTAVAVTANFTAIADGKLLYIYEGDITDGTAAGTYRVYTHENTVSQLAFDSDGNLYFLSEFELYKLLSTSLTAPTNATKMNIVCSGFTIDGNDLYYYAMSKTVLKRYSLASGTYADLTLSAPLQTNSPLTVDTQGLLYYVSEGNDGYTVHAINTDTDSSSAVATFAQPLKSITIANHLFCAVTNDGTFYAYADHDLSDSNAEAISPITDTSADPTDTNGYVSAYTFGDSIFAIRDNVIRQYSVSEVTFTDFEITSTSASIHRLNDANDIFLAENKLFIADNGNDRISVYSTETQSFEQAIPTTLPNPYLTSYKDTLFAASAQEAILYDLSATHYGEALLTVSDEEIDGTVIGAACVYNRYYLLTDDNYTYTFTATDGVWSYAKTKNSPKKGLYATAFTSDVFGGLYVTYNSGEMYRYTEKELTSPSATGTKVADGLHNAEKIAVDYDENLYALAGGILTKYTQNDKGMYEVNSTFAPNYSLVKDENPILSSFTFGVETTDAYFLYEGNYAVKSDELQIPKVNPIPVGNAADCIFGTDNRNFTAVTVKEDAILTEFDLSALAEATEFPYIAFERCYTPFTALKIGEEAEYSILVVQNGAIGYKTYLAETAYCEDLPIDEYRTTYAETETTGYLTSAAQLYKFPYLNQALTVAELPRSAKVTLLGEVRQLDRTYYEISYTNENGEAQTGFIPTSYLNLFDGTAPTTETITYGETSDDTDSVGRMLYILLGLGAIGILIDVLLLKKPKETDEDER